MLARMPPSPRLTASTSLGMGKEVITTSAPLVTSATDLAAVAARSVQVLRAAAFRSNTVTWWLLRLTMLRHMGPPMLPTPMNPTFTDPSPFASRHCRLDRPRPLKTVVQHAAGNMMMQPILVIDAGRRMKRMPFPTIMRQRDARRMGAHHRHEKERLVGARAGPESMGAIVSERVHTRHRERDPSGVDMERP